MPFPKQFKGKKYLLLLLLGVLAFLPLLRFIVPHSMVHCIFCDIAAGKSPTTVIKVETSEYMIFEDIKPATKHHYLAIPKRHLESLKTLTKDDIKLVKNMQNGLKTFFEKENISTEDALFGFHIPPFASVKHLHMHGMSPHSTMGFFRKIIYKPGSPWFKSFNEAIDYLRNKSS